jgi:hypothetical protein
MVKRQQNCRKMFNELKCDFKLFYEETEEESRVFLLDRCYLRLDYDEDKQKSRPRVQWENVKKLEILLTNHKSMC